MVDTFISGCLLSNRPRWMGWKAKHVPSHLKQIICYWRKQQNVLLYMSNVCFCYNCAIVHGDPAASPDWYGGTAHNTWTLLTHINIAQIISSVSSILTFLITKQGIHKRMARFQKLTRNIFLTLHGHNIHRQQRQLSKFLMRYQQFASHSYCGVAGPVSKMASQ